MAMHQYGTLLRLFRCVAADIDKGFDHVVKGVDIIVP